MKIESISVKNLRSIKEAIVRFDDYTCLVGPNGAGKSTVLFALNIFFREIENAPTDTSSLSSRDFYCGDVSAPMEVTVTFADIGPEATEDFKAYVRQGKLVISAVATFNQSTGRAEVLQYGQRLGMSRFQEFFKAEGDGAKVAELKTIFEVLEKEIPEIAAKKSGRTKDAMIATLRSYETERPEACELIRSMDQFYGVSKGANRLEKYVQWIFIPAVKDASDEQSEKKDGALGKLLARTVRAKVNFGEAVEQLLRNAREQYQTMLDSNQAALDDVSAALGKRMAEWAHPDANLRVEWQQDSTKAVKVDQPIAGVVAIESGFEGDLVRFGHGFQRSFLLALLQELASGDDKNAPRLILGCEEPELYQHPPQARHLASVFEKLSQANAQIIVTTHSPYFVSGRNFEGVRMVRRDATTKSGTVRSYSYPEISKRYAEVVGEQMKAESAAMAKVNQALQPMLNEMFFTQRLVLVEGLEDIAYIHSWLLLTNRWEHYRRSGCHIVPANGKSEIIRPAIIAQGLQIPVIAVFDSDGDKITRDDRRIQHERDNKALLRLFGGDDNNVFPTGVVFADQFITWPGDIADTFERECIAALGVQARQRFDDFRNRASAECGNAGDLNKTALYVGHLLAQVHDAGIVPQSLDLLCQKLVEFGAVPVPAVVSTNSESGGNESN
jgi:hypothetical protein